MTRTNPRRLRSLVLLLVPAVVVCAIALAVAAETLRIESVWITEAPAVDGKLTEWSAPLVTLGSTPLSLGVRNDGQFLYVALASSDQATRMMLGAAGFTVWMDPSGKNKKSFGITVPPIMTGAPGMRGRGPGGAPPDQSGQPPDWQGTTPPQGSVGGPGGSKGPAIGTITSIEVLGASKEDKRRLELAYARTIGLDVAARMAEGVLVYELRVPLPVSEAQPYGVKSAPGAIIGLGIETSQPPEPRGGRFGGVGAKSGTGGDPTGGGGGGRGGIPPPGMGGGGAGGMGGGGGQRGGMGGGPPEGGREGMRELKPIKIWTVVQLAKPPA
jgi:hypothetical protein